MSAAERFLTFLLCVVKMSDLEVEDDLAGRGREVEEDEVEMREESVLEKASDVEDEMGLCLVLEGFLVP